MNSEEILRWELAYAETARLDFERRIYEQCAAEDAMRESAERGAAPQER